jgi:hypothetical protein
MKNAESRFESLKKELQKLGYMRPGSLVRRFMPCGKETCACMLKTKPRLHGPYFQWSYKTGGKTRTVRLSEAQALACSKWIKNHKMMRKLIRQMEKLSLTETDRQIGAISRS